MLKETRVYIDRSRKLIIEDLKNSLIRAVEYDESEYMKDDKSFP